MGWAVAVGAIAGAGGAWKNSAAAVVGAPPPSAEPTMALGLSLPEAPRSLPTEPGIDRRKRTTPMREAAAAAHLRDAFTEELGAPPSVPTLAVLWAHWALETGRGLWMRDYNFAGIQGVAPDGGSALWWTSERIDGETQRVRLRFRAYATPEDGARDYVRLLRGRFQRAFAAASDGDARAFARELARATYFTSDGQDYERAVASLAFEFRSGPLAHVGPKAP